MTAQYDPRGRISLDTLTFRDVQHLLEVTGKSSFQEVMDSIQGEDLDAQSIDIIVTLIHISQKKVNPHFTREDAYELPLSVISEAMEDLSGNPTGSPSTD